MAQSPLESWKRSPPADRDEAKTAELIQNLGDAEKLSPQALNRVAHRLHPPARRRLPLFADARFAIAAVGGVLSLVAIAFIGIRFTGFEDHPSASAVRADRTIARNDALPPSAAPPAEQELEPARERDQFAEPPPREAQRVINSRGLLGAAEKTGRSFASPPATSAPSARGALVSDAAQESPSGADCRSDLAGFSATIASDSGDLERALFGRGSCWLRLGKREAGLADLRTYLGRFPEGRFAARARELLGQSPAP